MFFTNKKVLVTGASGFIGTNLIFELLKQKAFIRGTVHKKSPRVQDPRIEYISCNLVERQDCARAVKGMDFVFHTAANSAGAAAMKLNPITHITENVIMSSLLLEESFRENVERIQLLSTTTVYPQTDYPVKEEEAFVGDPYETYFGVGWTARFIEKLCSFYQRRFGMKISILRPTSVFGPFDKFDFETSHVLPALIRRAVEKQNPLEVWGDGTGERDFIYIDDLIAVMLLAMEKTCDGSVINVGSGRPVTIKESVELILKLTGQIDRLQVKFDPSKPTTIPSRKVDLGKSRALLNYQSQVSFEEGLRRTIQWYSSFSPSFQIT